MSIAGDGPERVHRPSAYGIIARMPGSTRTPFGNGSLNEPGKNINLTWGSQHKWKKHCNEDENENTRYIDSEQRAFHRTTQKADGGLVMFSTNTN